MSHRRRSFIAACFAVVAVIVSGAGCAFDQALEGTCADDSTCAGGTVCAFSFCIDPEALGIVDFEVEPPGAANLPIQTLLAVDTNSGGRIDVALSPAVEVSGFVIDDNDDAVGATVFAVPTAGIAGRRRQRSTTSTADGFSVALVRDQPYRFSALPTSATLPPAFADSDIVAGAGARNVLRVQGVQLVHGRVISIGETLEINALANCDVFIVDGNGRQLSSVATTGIDGLFEVTLGASSSEAQLVIRPNNQYPSLTMPVDLGDGPVVELVDTNLGELFTRAISGRVVNADNSPAARAVVVVRGEIGAGIVSVRQVTGDDGAFSVNVVRGSYTIGAVGESSSNSGISLTTVDVSASTLSGLVIALPARVNADLEVVTAEGNPVSGASVELTRVGENDTGIAEPVLRDAQPTFLASTDSDGHISIAVDPGRYRVSVEPPRGQGQPARSVSLDIAADFSRRIDLLTANVIAGTLRNGDAVVGGAFVRVYSQVVDERGLAIFLGEAISEPDGSFAVSVPGG